MFRSGMMSTAGGLSVEAEPAGRPNRRKHSVVEKRRIVEKTLVPGASVARVAWGHEVNANQVFKWRRLYQRGLPGGKESPVALVPVTVSDAQPGAQFASTPVAAPPDSSSVALSTIQLQLPKGCLHIEGAADPDSLRVLLEYLLG
jgi:transposase